MADDADFASPYILRAAEERTAQIRASLLGDTIAFPAELVETTP